MSEVIFYKLTLELNPKLNKEKVNLLERHQDIVDAKSLFNQASAGSKHLIILNLTQQTVNLILRLDNYVSSKPVGIRTINKFITILQNDLNWKTTTAASRKQLFKVSAVKSVELENCKAIVDALYSEGNELINSSDIQKLFSDVEDTSKEIESNASTCSNEEHISTSLENALEKISTLAGNAEFKKEIHNIVKFVDISKQLDHDSTTSVFPYHYIFKGENGMDHVMPAKLMAEVFYHLGLIKNRKFAVLNIPEESNEYSGINFECSIEVAETGVVFVEGIFDCEDENISIKKVLNKLSEKMSQYKGSLLFIISYYIKDDKGMSYKALIDSLRLMVNYRQIEFPSYSSTEMAELIEFTAKKKGYGISPDAVSLITENVLGSLSLKGLNIEQAVNNIVEKAFSDRAFALLNDNVDVGILSSLEAHDLGFLNSSDAPKSTDTAPVSELDTMIGLTDVKNRVQQICNVLAVRAKKKELGIHSKPVCLHMQFVGNPGTGKTTVARIMGKVMRNLGFLSSGHFVELTRNDLIGEYIGQTTPKVKKALKRSKGGIMFVDEAYSLYQGAENDYGYEAVSELVKGMEDFKDDMVVIFAGYPKEMEKMVNMNPGLRDRIAFKVEFPDYTPDELIRIFMKMCNDSSYTVNEDALEMLDGLFRKHFTARKENFGNARIIRKIFERVEIIQSGRVCEQNAFNQSDISVINISDVQKLNEDLEIQSIIKSGNSNNAIGFRHCN